MASAATAPLATSTEVDTLFAPFGAGWGRRLNMMTVMKRNAKPSNATPRSSRAGDSKLSTVRIIPSPSVDHIARAPSEVNNNGRAVVENHFGSTSHAPRNNALRSIPSGTTDMLAAKPSSPPATYIPTAAGTMVDGTDPNRPPTKPPHFSMATVTPVATMPANSAERRMETTANLSPPRP